MARSVTADPMRDRLRLLALLLGGFLVIGAAARSLLFLRFHEGPFSISRFLLVDAAGPLYDLLALVPALFPIALVLVALPGRWLGRAWFRGTLLAAAYGGAAFLAAAEYFFFEEFNSRFNHLALDYLLHPKEVFVNIWDSYDVPAVVLGSAAIGILLAGAAVRQTRGAAYGPMRWGQRARGALAIATAVAGCLVLESVVPAAVDENRIDAEIAQNGLRQLVSAFMTAELDYAQYYETLPEREAHARAGSFLGFPGEAGAAFVRPGAPPQAPRRDWDVLVVLEESLGSEFIGVLGHPERRTSPGFDRWSREGTLLTRLVATGNRTVRGLEGTLCSFVPLPGDSIVKRTRAPHVATLGEVLRREGYRTEFYYGGWGAFDSMRPFFPDNGYDAFVERGAFPDEAFHTIWGVADEYVFDAVLDRQKRAAAEGTRLFATVLTVSNHKPFDVPERSTFWPASRRNREAAVAYADWALSRYLDRAREARILDHTVVLVVGDHGARVYGAEQIPAASYRIPALFVVPDPAWKGRRIERLASQIDLAPTLLGILGIRAPTPFLGEDVASLPAEGGRAFLHHNRDLGLLTDDLLVVLELRKAAAFYTRPGPDSDRFEPVAPEAVTDRMRDLERTAAAVYQIAEEEYDAGAYVLGPSSGVAGTSR